MTLTIESTGDGADLALIHGWGIGASAWNELLPLLTPRLRVHLVTLPGYPAADRIERRSWPGTRQDPHGSTDSEGPAGKAPPAALSRPSTQNPPDFVDTAAAIADALPAGCALCGWSLGGLLALQAAALAPQRVGRLILCAATPSFMQREGWPHAQPPALLDGFAAALEKNPALTLQRFIALLNQGDGAARTNARTLARGVAADGLADGATLLRGLDWLRDVDLLAQPAAIALPTLIVHGENDPLMPLAAARWLYDTLPQSRLEVFAGAAHAPFLNDPGRFARLLIEFCHARTID